MYHISRLEFDDSWFFNLPLKYAILEKSGGITTVSKSHAKKS
jgi:hypothetical protein